MKNQDLVIGKQIVGVDIGKDEFYACYKVQKSDHSMVIKGTKSFDNTLSGLREFYSWCEIRNKTPEIKLVFVMEATGVYYEELAYFLHYKKQLVSVQLAQKVKYFAKSCNLKTKTDKVDSKMIANYGIEKNLNESDLWTPPSQEFKTIRDLAREHTRLKNFQRAAKSQLHALNYTHSPNNEVYRLKLEQLDFYEAQIKEVEKEIQRLVKDDNRLSTKIKNIETVKGLGFMTIIKIIAETNGFLLFKNIRQLVSYSGLDVVQNESGTFKGKTKISKKGNVRVRSALYMPAMTASRYNKTLKIFYERVNENRTIKRQGLIAVMRKLLIIIYTLWKTDKKYIENYQAV